VERIPLTRADQRIPVAEHKEEAPMVQTHEYLVAPLAGKPHAWQVELNRLASKGWELSDVIALAAAMSVPGEGPFEAVAFLKRAMAQ
jgi:hypothetical protein